MIKPLVLANEYTINRIGLGTNRIRNNNESKIALKTAVNLGINFIDTAAAYTGGESQEMIGQTLFPYPKDLVIATKGGMHVPNFHVDSSPQALKQQLEISLQKLKLDSISLYFLHRVDPNVPFDEQINFLKQMQKQGKIKHVGLSEVSVSQIEEAKKIVEIVAVENEYNLSQRKYEAVVDYCEKHNIVFVHFYPLHFHVSNEQKFVSLQQKYHATEAQLGLAWLLKRSPVIVPIPGSLSPTHLQENVAAQNIELSDKDYQLLSTITE